MKEVRRQSRLMWSHQSRIPHIQLGNKICLQSGQKMPKKQQEGEPADTSSESKPQHRLAWLWQLWRPGSSDHQRPLLASEQGGPLHQELASRDWPLGTHSVDRLIVSISFSCRYDKMS